MQFLPNKPLTTNSNHTINHSLKEENQQQKDDRTQTAGLLYHGLLGEETKITQKCEKKVTGKPIPPASGSKGT